VKHQIALCAAAVILGLATSDALLAQAIGPAYPPPYPPEYPGTYPPAPGGLPPYEVMAIVRSSGFEPLSRPLRQGPAYVVRAADPAGRLMHVFVDARMGRIVRVVPAMRRDAMSAYPSPPYPIPPGRGVPDGNGSTANSRIAGLPDGPDDIAPEERGPAPRGLPGAPPASARAAPKTATATVTAPAITPAGPPPLPRPRPKTASVAEPAPGVPASPVPSATTAAPSAPASSAPAVSPAPSAPAVNVAPSAAADPPLVELDE
jgi:hypothetical protein